MTAHHEFHEIWWIFSDRSEEWGGLRIAHFRKASRGELLVIMTGEVDQSRLGVRIWDDVAPREGWHKVAQIIPPTAEQIREALTAPPSVPAVDAD